MGDSVVAGRVGRRRGRIAAAAEAQLVEGEGLAVSAGRRATARAHGTPVAALEDRRALAGDHRRGPLVDVARHVVDAERAAAAWSGSRWLTLPEAVQFGHGLLGIGGLQGLRVARSPGPVDDARVAVALVPVRVRRRFFALAREGPLRFGAESLRLGDAEAARIFPAHHDP